MIYEILAYRQAFPGKEWQVVLPSILNDSPAPLQQIDTSLDPRLDDIVGKALARDPAERYQSLKSLGRDLADFRQQVEVTDADTTMPVPTPQPTAKKKSRPTTDSTRLNALRRTKVLAHVEAAHAALDRGDVESAQIAAEEASLLDVDDTQVVKLLEALTEATGRTRVQPAYLGCAWPARVRRVDRGSPECRRGARVTAGHRRGGRPATYGGRRLRRTGPSA